MIYYFWFISCISKVWFSFNPVIRCFLFVSHCIGHINTLILTTGNPMLPQSCSPIDPILDNSHLSLGLYNIHLSLTCLILQHTLVLPFNRQGILIQKWGAGVKSGLSTQVLSLLLWCEQCLLTCTMILVFSGSDTSKICQYKLLWILNWWIWGRSGMIPKQEHYVICLWMTETYGMDSWVGFDKDHVSFNAQ